LADGQETKLDIGRGQKAQMDLPASTRQVRCMWVWPCGSHRRSWRDCTGGGLRCSARILRQ
jgi:hypothetical protein